MYLQGSRGDFLKIWPYSKRHKNKKTQRSAKKKHLERHKAQRRLTKGLMDIDLDFVAVERSQPLTQPTLVPEPMR